MTTFAFSSRIFHGEIHGNVEVGSQLYTDDLRKAHRMSQFWQHEDPLRCPKRHLMIWLGSAFWICEKCHRIYVQMAPRERKLST